MKNYVNITKEKNEMKPSYILAFILLLTSQLSVAESTQQTPEFCENSWIEISFFLNTAVMSCSKEEGARAIETFGDIDRRHASICRNMPRETKNASFKTGMDAASKFMSSKFQSSPVGTTQGMVICVQARSELNKRNGGLLGMVGN
ncbi:hypothetical protein [Ferriphaselus sp. R-1]|uniref:hypothetical protein n=1 Tax=Ferriphaselus sp. R-1 TaxID=1485544 RepID=UPI0005525477|nr:hypothetical protein [Ferriphaselus sp. R-1]